MLKIHVPIDESFDDDKQEFVVGETIVLELEHSLLSLSKWESEFEKPFLNDDEKTPEETVEYIRAMTLTPNVETSVYDHLSNENLTAINAYVNAKMTATWFSDPVDKRKTFRSETITSELIYYWMIALGIPFECENWHLNRLLTLVQVCNVKNKPEKKMNRREAAERIRALNAERKARLNTRG